MADKKYADRDSGEFVIAKAKDFWGKYGKMLTIVSAVIILLGGAWIGYNYFVVKPKEAKAAELMFKAEEYFRTDSISKALNGDGQHWGFLRIISKYKGTKSGKMASFYAASCYIKLNENEKAIKLLKDFKTSSKPVQARAYKLMADAYGDLGNHKQALEYYQKAGRHFEKDEAFSSESLFLGAYLAQRVLNDSKTAISLYKELKQKFPQTQHAIDADNYLAQMGVYSTDN
jgi:tetratricopeptide (TPR) repeat protein